MTQYKPLELLKYESRYVLELNAEGPEAMLNPSLLLDMLGSLKICSISPGPIDCRDIELPLPPLFLSACRTSYKSYLDKKTPMGN